MSDPLLTELHRTLLRVAGWLPDDVLTAVRGLAAAGDAAAAARALVFAGTRTSLPLNDADVDLLADLLSAGGADPGLVRDIPYADENEHAGWSFDPVPAADAGLDGDGTALIAAAAETELVSAVDTEPGVRGAWAVWRSAPVGVSYPPPRPVYVVEIDDVGACPGLTGRLQDLLMAAGDRAPQVEVVSRHEDPPMYQRAARAGGRLLWAPADDRVIEVAKVFDAVDPRHGPSFAADHPVIGDEAERRRLLDYLDAGTELLTTTALLPDLVEPDRGEVVPMNFRTDGTWVWTDTVSYYLREHGLAPDPDLWKHIADANEPPTRPDTVTLNKVIAALSPEGRKPVWSASGEEPAIETS
ncbi:hypothetical protein AB5J62_24505 [Amycolatopsis sp. cg5]|uniref:hypothetical protein n=1 Tax=Amycolatopsis sp. cg5 TaxID=3238802 RepID=UPI00352547A7